MLEALAECLPVLLNKNLVGVYLFGSLTLRAFDHKSSDVDCVVVTKRVLSESQFRKLREWLEHAKLSNPWFSRLQMLLLLRDEVLTMDSPACLYQHGVLKRSYSDGNPIIWLNILKSGCALNGVPAASFVPEITAETLRAALKRELSYLKEEISQRHSEWRNQPSYRVYAVLTLCRILYSSKKGRIVSKRVAARWANRHLPEGWSSTIGEALGEIPSEHASGLPLERIRQLIELVDLELQVV